MEHRPLWSGSFCPKTSCGHFHHCVKEFCVMLPWTKASERYVSFHQSFIISSFFNIISCDTFLLFNITNHTWDKRWGEVRSKNGLEMTAEVYVSNLCKAIFVTQISFRLVMQYFWVKLTYFSVSILFSYLLLF